MRRYIRHHTGVVHDVAAEHFNVHLAQARNIRYDDPATEIAREATPEEVAAHWAAQGLVYVPESDEALTAAEHAERAAKAEAAAAAAKKSAPAKE